MAHFQKMLLHLKKNNQALQTKKEITKIQILGNGLMSLFVTEKRR